MLREIVTIAAFILILAGLISSFVIVQRLCEHQITQVELIMEEANEIN